MIEIVRRCIMGWDIFVTEIPVVFLLCEFLCALIFTRNERPGAPPLHS